MISIGKILPSPAFYHGEDNLFWVICHRFKQHHYGGADTVDKTFVTLNADTPTYAPSLGLSQANQKGQYIYIMLDYYSAAITSFYSYNIGMERFNKGLAFGCDFPITFYRIDNDRGKV